MKKTSKNPANKELAAILSAADKDYSYNGIETDYRRDRSDCECPDYCRCSTIEDFEIKNIDLNDITASFTANITNPILSYAISRLPTLHKLYEEESFEPDIQQGYYGEEFCGVYIRHKDEIKTDITTLYNMSDKERIEFVLNKEYGYIADTLKNVKAYNVVEALIENLHMPPSNDMFKLDTKHIKGLTSNFDDKLPIGIYLPRGKDEYSVADGRHRLSAAKNIKLNKAKIIVGEK